MSKGYAAPLFVWTLGHEGFMNIITPPSQRFLGWHAQDLQGISVAELLQANDRPQLQDAIGQVLNGIPCQLDIPLRTKEGDYHPVELSMVPQFMDGKAASVYVLAKDISERQHMEAELTRSNEELQHFAYIASHDLQEPLRMISSYLKLIERRYAGRLDKDADEFIAFAVDGAERLQNMINGLLEFSRVETRGKPFKPVDLEEVLNDALSNLEMAIGENNVDITHEPLPKVTGDANQLISLLQNLLSNAIKFRKKNVPLKIHIGVKQGAPGWVFSVQDNGIGIDPAYLEQIFTIFQRLHGRGEYPGTGIGLAVCKRIVERHGGTIWVESQPDMGSTFYFSLPDDEVSGQ